MKLFKKKEVCCCGAKCNEKTMEQAQLIVEDKGIKVLGSGCKKCESLETNVKHALYELGIEMVVEHVSDFEQIAAYGVMSTPALVYNGEVVSFGKVLSKDEIKVILSEEGVN